MKIKHYLLFLLWVLFVFQLNTAFWYFWWRMFERDCAWYENGNPDVFWGYFVLLPLILMSFLSAYLSINFDKKHSLAFNTLVTILWAFSYFIIFTTIASIIVESIS